MYTPDYIKMLKNLKYYLNKDIKFVDYDNIIYKSKPLKQGIIYPVGHLEDIEIHFLHYKDETEVVEKWHRRLSRFNWDKVYIKLSESNLCTEELIKEFDMLDFKHKVCFTAKKYPYELCIHFTECKEHVTNEWDIYKKYFDIVGWLNE